MVTQAVVWWVIPAQLRIFKETPADERRAIYPEDVDRFLMDIPRDPRPKLYQMADVRDMSFEIPKFPDDDLANIKWVFHMIKHSVGVAMTVKTAQITPMLYGFWTDQQMKPIVPPYLLAKPITAKKPAPKKIAAENENKPKRLPSKFKAGPEVTLMEADVKVKHRTKETQSDTKRKPTSPKKKAPAKSPKRKTKGKNDGNQQ